MMFMNAQNNPSTLGCHACIEKVELDFDFTMAFQPIVNVTTQGIYAYEALVRGRQNEPARQIFEHVNDNNRYRFDQVCRIKAVELAAKLRIPCFLSINFMPNAVYQPELCIRTTLAAAEKYNFPIEQIIFEITEGEKVEDHQHLQEIVKHYNLRGFKVAIDDFGAGYAGLNFLANVRTDIVKLDMALIRHIEQDKIRQAIVRGLLQVCAEIEAIPIAEGIETREELSILYTLGIELMQGYYFAEPAFEALPAIKPTAFADN